MRHTRRVTRILCLTSFLMIRTRKRRLIHGKYPLSLGGSARPLYGPIVLYRIYVLVPLVKKRILLKLLFLFRKLIGSKKLMRYKLRHGNLIGRQIGRDNRKNLLLRLTRKRKVMKRPLKLLGRFRSTPLLSLVVLRINRKKRTRRNKHTESDESKKLRNVSNE